MNTIMEPIILDQWGKPAQTTGANWYQGPDDSEFRQSAPRLDYDIRAMLTNQRHRLMIGDARNIVRSYSPLAGAIQQKADMVSTNLWAPCFEGDDVEWGDSAEYILERHLKGCDVRGRNFRFSNAYRIASWLLDIDGDCFRVKIRDPKTGVPKIQSFEAHRVGSPGSSRLFNPSWFSSAGVETRRLAASLDGAQIQNGIVLGQYGEELAIVITDGTWANTPIALVPAQNYWHIVEPEWFSECRGTPKLAYCIYDWYDLKETREAEKIKQKSHSKQSMVEDNTTGWSEYGGARTGPTPVRTEPSVIPMENGMVRYFKAGSGSKLTLLNSNTPGDSWQRFGATVEQGAFYAIGWNRALLDPEGINSATNHAVAEQINYSIFKRFDNLEFYAKNELQWHVAGLIETKRLKDSPEWYKWTVAQPPEYAVHQSKNNAATIESIRAGTETHPRVIRAKGGRPLKFLREEAKFLKAAKAIAEKEGILYTDLIQTAKPGDPMREDMENPPKKENTENET